MLADPKKRQASVKKSPGIPTRVANSTPKAGKGIPKSKKTSQRFNRAALYRAVKETKI